MFIVAKRQNRPAAEESYAPSRLTRWIVGLVIASLVIGALGFYFNIQTEELTQTVFGAEATLEVPTSAPPTPRFAFVPPEESDDVTILAQPTVLAQATAVPLEKLPTASGKLDKTLNVLLLGSDRRPGEPVWRTPVLSGTPSP